MTFLSEPNIETLLNSMCLPEQDDCGYKESSRPHLPIGEASSDR